MVAYSFERRFVNPIRLGLGLEPWSGFEPAAGPKRHTIRGHRKRHARPGEVVQLYFGMRTQHCRLIGRPICWCARNIILRMAGKEGVFSRGFTLCDFGYGSLDEFAIGDGFADWAALKAFWRDRHGPAPEFDGVMILWGGAT